MHVRGIAGDTNCVEVQCGTENKNWLAGQCSITSNYKKKLFAL
jgi:hypothetical protein